MMISVKASRLCSPYVNAVIDYYPRTTTPLQESTNVILARQPIITDAAADLSLNCPAS